METRATRRSGQKGTLKHPDQYGDRLLFARYRYNPETNMRLTTVELIVDERPSGLAPAKTPPPVVANPKGNPARLSPAETPRGIRARRTPDRRAGEQALRDKARAAGPEDMIRFCRPHVHDVANIKCMLQKFIVPGTDATGSPGDRGPAPSWASSVSTREEARMEARATLRPGQKGTKKLVTRFGDRLICVRYRYDATRRKRFTTVELIVDESDWTASIPIAAEAAPPVPTESPTETATEKPAGAPKEPYVEPSPPKPDLVGLRVGFKEMDLRQKVKAVGAKWDPGRRLWMLRRDRAIELGLQKRIATPVGEQNGLCY